MGSLLYLGGPIAFRIVWGSDLGIGMSESGGSWRKRDRLRAKDLWFSICSSTSPVRASLILPRTVASKFSGGAHGQIIPLLPGILN